MSFRSLASLRCAVSLAAVLAVSACTDDRAVPLSLVETIDIPVADAGPQANQNISNPTLFMPETFQVSDGDQLTLVWSEEFDGPEIDPEVWFFATGDGTEKGLAGGWGNNELQYYLPDNAMIVNGVLEITARRETVGNLDYTSARINTEDRFAFKYGRIEASMKLPPGQGIWPAFWMLSQDSDYLCDGEPCIWAATGEIDIMEAVNLDGTGGNEIYGTLHYGGEAPANVFTGDRYTPSVDVTEGFHTYAIEWDEFEIRWYFDGQLYSVQNSWDSSADGKDFPAPFDQPFHILLNVAVGGNFPGSPDGTTPFPTTMEVDWVRVYSGEGPAVAPAEPAALPVDFERAASSYDFGADSGFEGGAASVIPNPQSNGINASAQVGQMQKFMGASFGGATLVVEPTAVASGSSFTMKVWSQRSVNVLFQPEPAGPGSGVEVTHGATGWEELTFDFGSFADSVSGITLIFDNGTPGAAGTDPFNWTFYFDDIALVPPVGGGGAEPTTAATTPTEDAADVVSLFSNAYSDVAVGDFSTTWDTADVSDVQVAGDDVKKYVPTAGGASLGFIGINFDNANAIDGTGYDTLRMDIWTPDVTNLLVKLVDFGGDGFEGANADTTGTSTQTLTQGSWQTISIPFSEFMANGLMGVTELSQIVLEDLDGASGGTTLYVDNLYFFNSAGSGGSGGGGEIAVNGGFESGDFSGWETSPGGGTQAIVTDNPSSGTYAVNLTVPVRTQTDPPVDNVIKIANLQAGNLTPGASITVSFDMRGSLSGAGGVVFAELFSELSGGGTSKSEILGGGPLTPVTAWTNYSFTTTLGDDVSGGVSLQLKASCGPVEGCGVDVFFDNVSIVIGDGGDTGGGDTGGGDTGGGGVGEELAVNGDFETGDLTGWTPDSTTGGLIEVVDTGASGGIYAVHLVAGTTQSPLIKQVQLGAGAVMPNSTVTVSFDMKGTITGVGGVVFAEFFSEGNPVAQQFLGGGPIFPTAEWATYNYTVTTGPDVSQGITLQFVAVCGAEECGVDVFFDNVSITAVLGDGGGGDTGGGDPGVASGSCGGSEEQASNCDFESGDLTGWTVFDNGGLIEVVDTGTGAGANAAHLVAGPANNPLIKQFELAAGAVSPGDTVNISFDMRGTLSGEGGVVFAEFFSEGDPTTGEIITGGPIFPTFDWATYTYVVTAGADVSRGITFQLAAVCGAVAGCGVDVFFDNVSIVIPGVDGGGGDTGGGDTGGGGTVLVTFDEATPPTVVVFGGAVATIEAGPAGGDDTNALRILRDGGDDFAGAYVFVSPIPGDAGAQTVSALVYSPTADIPMPARLVRTDGSVGTGDVQANETVVVGWQTLTWTFTNLDPAEVYPRFAMLPNSGTVDTATSYYFDNITLLDGGDTGGGDTGGGAEVVLATFDETTPPVVTDFGGAVSVIEAGPAGGDGNALNIVRNGGEVFAGSWIAIPAIPSNAGTQTVSALVYSPTAGIPMVAKAEFGENTGTGDVQANETVVVGWQTLTWTFTNLDPAQTYNRFVMLPNLGTVDTATSYFFDNITLLGTGGGG